MKIDNTKYLTFAEIENKGNRLKTRIFEVVNLKSDYYLGTIRWYGPWRQYCFMPEEGTVFNKTCLSDINNVIDQLMDERKK